MKKIAILQSNYLPWKGVFDLINKVDVFVFLEDVQYSKRDWRNRNKIMTNKGLKWLTVPVRNKGISTQLIFEVKIDNTKNWQWKHSNFLYLYYKNTKYFNKYKWILDELYGDKKWFKLSDLNIYSTKLISDILGINTKFYNSVDLSTTGSKDDKLIAICKKINADYYLSGPAAQAYINPEKFKENNIILDYINYQYPEYQQAYKPFRHDVSILDLIFNCGPIAPDYIWGWR